MPLITLRFRTQANTDVCGSMRSGRRLGNRQHMATADIPPDTARRRLDSWKEIAEYLRRDVRTAMRWESQGLPLHRVAGGRSVFAFTNEIDAWMAGHPAEQAGSGQVGVIPPSGVASPVAAATPSRKTRFLRVAVLLVAATVVAMFASRQTASTSNVPLRVSANGAQVSLIDASGVPRVIHEFDAGAVLLPEDEPRIENLTTNGAPDIVTSVAYYDDKEGRSLRSGELVGLSTAGDVRWRFGFDDVLKFSGGTVSGPWSFADWQSDPSTTPKRIAVAAHEATWWASLVAVLDHNGRRQGAFVNPGWIESVLWRSKDRLAVAGFNNMRDEAMLAMLDANHSDGQAPGSAGTMFACVSCPTTAPLFYATFARSELNRVTAARFSRARVTMSGETLVVTTVEIAREGGDATAIYEFDKNLQFIRARFSDTYWDEHKRLELEGRLHHDRARCSERNGPTAIHVWDNARGWMRVAW